MNIKLSVNLQLPKECESYSKEELHALLFNNVIHYAKLAHQRDVISWLANRTNILPADTQPMADHHELWSGICSTVTFTIENVEK
jgi:hypothetical protein